MKKLVISLLAVSLLQGCAVAVIAGIGAGAASIHDRRTLGSQLDDQAIEVKAHSLIAENKDLDEKTRVQVVSVNGTVLVVGQAPNAQLKEAVIKSIADIQGIKKLHNQIRLNKLTSMGTRSHDTWLTSKVKAQLIASDKIDGTAIKVVTEDSEVFLMGLVNKKEADVAVGIVRNINGVSRVYKAFEAI
ncbi:BON domain-containing protein [Thalassotalea crassostreae]|uniref:BON domain-containing protein n=1 Tax=Thalassotalea crassostreae TaxID=1763536 RepID=UPI0008398C7A|nr:BON domain-containing protein [Thalassotalea crassostreae]